MTGQTISHYKILEKLGEGGMGVVYKAEDVKLKRIVAIKFLPKRLSVHGEERERFTLEAQAASALNHPNISTIYEIDEANGEAFIVMEYIDGVTLREWIRRRSAQPEGYRKTGVKESIELAIQIAEGLDKAHDKGIVHRDIKSENVMVTAEDGRAKIMDFGLAKLGGVSKLTKTGSTIGTVAYMSPEQVEGQETDKRTDIFSFGVMLYEMLAGVLPFRAAHETAMMYEILNVEPAPLADLNKSIDAELDRIVLKCLEKNRDERYQSMRDVIVDLRRYNRDSAGKSIDRSGVRRASPAAPTPEQRSRLPLIGTIAVAVLFLAAGAWYIFGHKASVPESLAVLPFVNVGTDPEQDYLTEGITDNLINKLSKLSHLRVIPRSLVAKYKGKDVDPRDAGKELNVEAVLTGKIVQRGDGLTIQTELVDVKNVAQLWGEQYDKKLSDILSVQQDIAQKVTEKLQTQISGEEQKHLATPHSSSPEAYQLYLKGRYYWNKRTDESSLKAMEYFTRASEVDPGYAQAYAGLADIYLTYSPTATQPKVYMPRLRAAAMKALELDPNLAEAHASLAAYKGYFQFDFAGAEQEWRTAIALDPGYPSAHHWLAEFLCWQGRFEEGFAEYNRAIALDPLSLAIASDLGAAYYYSRQYDRSIEQLKKTMEMDPHFVRSHFYIIAPYKRKNLPDSAFAELLQGMALRGDSTALIAKAKAIYASGGFSAIARFGIESGVRLYDYQSTFDIAQNYVETGDYEKAISLLEEAYDGQVYFVVTIGVDPAWDPLRTNPRFIALLKKLGIQQPPIAGH